MKKLSGSFLLKYVCFSSEFPDVRCTSYNCHQSGSFTLKAWLCGFGLWWQLIYIPHGSTVQWHFLSQYHRWSIANKTMRAKLYLSLPEQSLVRILQDKSSRWAKNSKCFLTHRKNVPKIGTKAKWINTQVLFYLLSSGTLLFFFTIVISCLRTQYDNIMNYIILDFP